MQPRTCTGCQIEAEFHLFGRTPLTLTYTYTQHTYIYIYTHMKFKKYSLPQTKRKYGTLSLYPSNAPFQRRGAGWKPGISAMMEGN
jgi:hypothetical protein